MVIWFDPLSTASKSALTTESTICLHQAMQRWSVDTQAPGTAVPNTFTSA